MSEISLSPSDTNFRFILERLYVSLRLAFAMTIKRAQGQPLLQEPEFTHRRLYVTFSSVRTLDSIHGPMLDTLYWCQNIFGSFRYQHSLHSEEARVSNRSEFLATRACIYAWTALCGFFTCVNFGWHTSKVEAQILTGTNVGHTVLVPKIYFAPSDISLPFILKRHQFSLKLAFAMTINNIWDQYQDKTTYIRTITCPVYIQEFKADRGCRWNSPIKQLDGLCVTQAILRPPAH
ncbi:hypothetical protein LAZ67_2001064 [Cordylochernes scorpioides]|uniref:Uncharacterized protein n=1 Tax=Cordylochernes scorpioides TaxID=51811 RepID=A0ABY6K446_9ARAC|nr:hypothetical protein LAZ67_2001064 [Cordylochernes scorpioides]